MNGHLTGVVLGFELVLNHDFRVRLHSGSRFAFHLLGFSLFRAGLIFFSFESSAEFGEWSCEKCEVGASIDRAALLRNVSAFVLAAAFLGFDADLCADIFHYWFSLGFADSLFDLFLDI